MPIGRNGGAVTRVRWSPPCTHTWPAITSPAARAAGMYAAKGRLAPG
ncbi:hypothetical protein ABZW11_08230 [Nonomuraea sp. NPDC004580]